MTIRDLFIAECAFAQKMYLRKCPASKRKQSTFTAKPQSPATCTPHQPYGDASTTARKHRNASQDHDSRPAFITFRA
jgi:hypothetical protein